jgi:hypothetical protein
MASGDYVYVADGQRGLTILKLNQLSIRLDFCFLALTFNAIMVLEVFIEIRLSSLLTSVHRTNIFSVLDRTVTLSANFPRAEKTIHPPKKGA